MGHLLLTIWFFLTSLMGPGACCCSVWLANPVSPPKATCPNCRSNQQVDPALATGKNIPIHEKGCPCNQHNRHAVFAPPVGLSIAHARLNSHKWHYSSLVCLKFSSSPCFSFFKGSVCGKFYSPGISFPIDSPALPIVLRC